MKQKKTCYTYRHLFTPWNKNSNYDYCVNYHYCKYDRLWDNGDCQRNQTLKCKSFGC